MYVAKHEMMLRSIRHDEIDLIEEVLCQAVFKSNTILNCTPKNGHGRFQKPAM